MTRRIRALVVKDLRLHWKGIVGVHAGAVVLCLSALALGGPRDPGTLGAFVANMNVISLLLWGEWFISREKTKGTFAWLGTLPISAFELGAAYGGVCWMTIRIVASRETRYFVE